MKSLLLATLASIGLSSWAVVGKLYGLFFTALANKEHDLIDDTIKCMLTTSSYSPDQDAHNYKDDVTDEITGTGYAAGGATVAGKTITYTAATNKWVFDCNDPSWPSSTLTARTAVFYNDTPASASAKGLIAYQQSDGDISTTNGTLTVQIAAAGLVEITVG